VSGHHFVSFTVPLLPFLKQLWLHALRVYAPEVVLRMHVISLPLLVNSFSVDVIARGFFWCNNTLWAEGDI
jgi:hypothetical protein